MKGHLEKENFKVEASRSLWVRGQPGLQSEFQDSQGYAEKHCLKKPEEKKRKEKENSYG